MNATILVYSALNELIPTIKKSIESHLDDHIIQLTSKESTFLNYLNQAVFSFLIVVNGSRSLIDQLEDDFPASRICFLNIVNDQHKGILTHRFEQDILPKLIKFYIYIHSVQERRSLGQRLHQKTLIGEEKQYLLPSKPDLIDFWIPQFLNRLVLDYCIESHIVVALELSLREALNNAVIHGNFELSSEIRDQEGGVSDFLKLVRNCQENPTFQKRMVSMFLSITSSEIKIVIEDEGKGFKYDHHQERLFKQHSGTHGRGIKLIQHYMDTVYWNEHGNQITLIKKYYL